MSVLASWFDALFWYVYEFLIKFDFREIFYAAFGAFIGFALTVFLENRSNKSDAKKKKVALLKNIYIELSNAYTSLKGSDIAISFFIEVPVYEATVHSGSIFCFVEDDYYVALMDVYLQIKYMKHLEDNLEIKAMKPSEDSDSSDESDEYLKIKKDIVALRKDTLDKLTEILPKIYNMILKLDKTAKTKIDKVI